MKMKVITVGTGTCVPSAKRRAPCNYLCLDENQFLIDAGCGSLRALAEEGINYSELDGIFFTHFHTDHIGELLSILSSIQADYTVTRTRELVLYGPVGLETIITGLRSVFGEWMPQEKIPVVVQELAHGDRIEINGSFVEAFHMPHLDHSLGYRFTSNKGKVAAFSGDTSYGKEVVGLVQDADIAVLECSFAQEETNEITTKAHLTSSLAGAIAQEGNVNMLVLSHINPTAGQYPLKQECEKTFSGTIVVAQDGMVFEV